jgi:hypothetical protein
MPEPSGREVRIKVRVSGVGPTDLKIRRGDLKAVFPLPEPAVLKFETAGSSTPSVVKSAEWRSETRWLLGCHNLADTASTRSQRPGLASRLR